MYKTAMVIRNFPIKVNADAVTDCYRRNFFETRINVGYGYTHPGNK